MTKETPALLTPIERYAIEGLQAQGDAVQAEYVRLIALVAERDRAICAEIAARLGLPPNAIGTTHSIDTQTWAVVAKPPHEESPTPIRAEAT